MGTVTDEQVYARSERFMQLARASGMPTKTSETHVLMNFLPCNGTRQAYQSAIDFATDKREHHFITFVGEPGRGKTHLALGIGWQWIGQYSGQSIDTVRYWQVSELLDAMREEYNNPPKDQYGFPMRGELKTCESAGLLILDDIGTEYHKRQYSNQDWAQSWVDERLDTLVNHRWLEEKPTVFTTNLAPSQLQPRIRSRLKEGVVVTLEGPDYRELKAKLRRR